MRSRTSTWFICKVRYTKVTDDGTEKKTLILDNPYEGLYVANNMWREMSEFSEGAVLMVFASKYYDENDYIRDYDEFLKFIGKK